MNMWSQVGSFLAGLVLIHAMLKQHFPESLKRLLSKRANKLMALLSTYVRITFPEYSADSYRLSHAYSAIKSYLSASQAPHGARRRGRQDPHLHHGLQ